VQGLQQQQRPQQGQTLERQAVDRLGQAVDRLERQAVDRLERQAVDRLQLGADRQADSKVEVVDSPKQHIQEEERNKAVVESPVHRLEQILRLEVGSLELGPEGNRA